MRDMCSGRVQRGVAKFGLAPWDSNLLTTSGQQDAA